MKKKVHITKSGLKKLPVDARDFPLGSIFKKEKLENVPEIDFIIKTPLEIKDQGNSDLCSAFALTAVSEDQEGVILSPEFQFAKTKELSGDIEEWGADLRTACKSAMKVGSLTKEEADKYLEEKGIDKSNRDKVADWKNWSVTLDMIAGVHKKHSFFTVENEADNIFDAIRVALWSHKQDNCSVITGANWHEEWTKAKYGIIPGKYPSKGYGHAFKIFGQKIINGKIYLVAQLSNGVDIGDKGLFYFSKEIVNKEFKYGAYMFKDIPPSDVTMFMKTGIKVGDPWYIMLYKIIKNIFKK